MPQPGEAVLDPVLEAYEAWVKNNFASGPLSEGECTNLILQLSQYRPLATIDIDALDECDPRRRRELFDALSAILQTSRSLTKIFVASRDDRDISLFLEGCINLDIDVSNNSEDINHFVKSEVDNWIKTKRLLYGKLSAGLRDDIKQRLQTQAHRMSVQNFHYSINHSL